MMRRKANIARIAAVLGMALITAAGCQLPGLPNEAGSPGGAKLAAEIRLAEGQGARSPARYVGRGNPNDPNPAIAAAAGLTFEDNEKVRVYVNETAGNGVVAENKEFKSDTGVTSFSPVSDNDKIYYPGTGNVNIYAAYPGMGLSLPGSGSPHPLEVKKDQSGKPNYVESDFLYAFALNKPKSSTPVGLTFNRMLSKIRIAVTPGAGLNADDLSGATLEIVGTKRKGTFYLDPGDGAAHHMR